MGLFYLYVYVDLQGISLTSIIKFFRVKGMRRVF